MQAITSTQREYLQEGGPVGVTINAELLDGNITLTSDEIKKLTIDRRSVSGNNIEIGCAYTSELVFELENFDDEYSSVTWEGARLTVVLDINGEPLQAGIFTVDEQPRKFSIMQIRALDDMARFNRIYETDLSYPATLEQILIDACSKCNVTLYTVDFDNKAYVVDEKPSNDYTFHQIVGYVAQLAGCNAWIDHLSRLNLSWYGGTPEDIDEDITHTAKMEGKDITITGIAYRTPDVDYISGTDDYALVIEDNPLLQEDYETILTALFNKIGGFSYRPYSFSIIRYPHLWPGDMVTINGEIQSIITNHKFSLTGNSAIEAKGETGTVKGYATGAPFTGSQKRVLRSVAKAEVERQTSGLEQATLHLNELMANALGLYPTVIEQETGAKLFYMHDNPTLEESMIIWHWTEQGLAWTDQGWNDGNPDWQYGVLADGNAVLKVLTALGINADWINAGRVSAEHVQIGPETDYYPGQRYTWQQYQGKTWQEAIENV